MKISIITEGFQNTGYGHITRCLSLYQAFEEKNIYPTLYINGDEKAENFLACTNYKLINWLNHPVALIKEIINSDILIIDSYLASKEFYDNLSKFCRILLIIDDYIRLDYSSGIILNGTINAESFPYQRKSSLEYLLGPNFIPIRKEFWNANSRKFNRELKSILITYGGQDIRNLTIPTLKAIHDFNSDINLKIVFGNKNKDEINNLKDKYRFAEFYHSLSANEMKELMMNCDIAIAAAGQTLYELATTGTPTISVEVAENQKNNILEWHKAGFIIEPISYNDIDFARKIVDQIERLQSIRLRRKISSIGKTKVDGQGSRRVVNYLIEKHCQTGEFYLRKATLNDSKIVFELSNDPIVRSQSINKNFIRFDEHLKWFGNKIKNKDYLFLLAFDKRDNFIGQIRFQIEDRSAIISISITEKFRGKGLSKRMIIEGCKKVFTEFSSIKEIFAYILTENVASINGFRSAGFELVKEEVINNEKYLKLVLGKGRYEN